MLLKQEVRIIKKVHPVDHHQKVHLQGPYPNQTAQLEKEHRMKN